MKDLQTTYFISLQGYIKTMGKSPIKLKNKSAHFMNFSDSLPLYQFLKRLLRLRKSLLSDLSSLINFNIRKQNHEDIDSFFIEHLIKKTFFDQQKPNFNKNNKKPISCVD